MRQEPVLAVGRLVIGGRADDQVALRPATRLLDTLAGGEGGRLDGRAERRRLNLAA
jgi:hypothetical protein